MKLIKYFTILAFLAMPLSGMEKPFAQTAAARKALAKKQKAKARCVPHVSCQAALCAATLALLVNPTAGLPLGMDYPRNWQGSNTCKMSHKEIALQTQALILSVNWMFDRCPIRNISNHKPTGYQFNKR